MKYLLLIIALLFTSCIERGETQLNLNGGEGLPDELKGLKVYTVGTGAGTYVKVAVLSNKVNSTTYRYGKTTQHTIIIDNRKIDVSEILVENDSIIVCRK